MLKALYTTAIQKNRAKVLSSVEEVPFARFLG